MSLHANERIMLKDVLFFKKTLHKAKSLNHSRTSVKIIKYGTNKYIMISTLVDTRAQSSL